jgi:putative nucleotidyltransferase with HDIG domain
MTRILFVDDDPSLIEGLRDSLRSQRKVWRMRFVLGGEAALAELEREPADVVVSDMRMPGIDGCELLARVQTAHPGAVRIILTGEPGFKAELRTVAVAHRVLAKPCDTATLRATITQACELQALITDEKVRALVHGTGRLPSPPDVVTRLNVVLADPEGSLSGAAALIESDVAVSAKVLQLVNSGFFGLPRRVTSINEATVYLGVETLRALVTSAAVFEHLSPVSAIPGFSLEQLEAHSRLTSAIAGQLLPGDDAATAATAGLLHDIGQLLLARHNPDALCNALESARVTGRRLDEAELELLGTTHAEVGAALLAVWGLPHQVVEAVANHHRPDRAPERQLDATLAVHIADALAHEAMGDRPAELEPLLAGLGLAERLPEWRAAAAEAVAG